MLGEYKEIPLDLIRRGRFQPRQHFSQEKLEELADSYAEWGSVTYLGPSRLHSSQGSPPSFAITMICRRPELRTSKTRIEKI